MAKFYGHIGFAMTVNTVPGVWEEQITEKEAYGDLLKASYSNTNSGNVNDNLNINHRISIVMTPFFGENFQHIIYVRFMGALWKAKSITVEYPRLIIDLGDVYNGPTN